MNSTETYYNCSENLTVEADCHEKLKHNPIQAFFLPCEVADFFAVFGFLLCLFFFISPIYELNKIRKNQKEIVNYPKYSTIFNLINTSLQIGIVIHNIENLPFNFVGNLVGATFNLSYFFVYLFLLYRNKYLIILLNFVGLICVFGLILIFFWELPFIKNFKCGNGKPQISSDPLVAIPVIIVNILMFIAPMQNLNKAYKSLNPNLISLKIAFIGFCFSGFILVYGIIKGFYFIYIPNSVGLFINTFSILLYFYIRKQMKKIDNNSLLHKIQGEI